MFLQSSPLSSSVVRMEFGREVFHDGLEPLDASRLAQGEKSLLRDSCFSQPLEQASQSQQQNLELPLGPYFAFEFTLRNDQRQTSRKIR